MIHLIFLLLACNCILYFGLSEVRVAVVCFQQDDSELIDYWIRYHAALFGINNIAVLDNFSRNASVLAQLEHWRERGARILYKQGPYARKGQITTAAFHEQFPKHDIAIALDADEFLVSYRNGVPIINGTMIRSDIVRFWKSPFYCSGMRQYYSNHMTENKSIETSEHVNNGPVYPVDGCKHYGKLKNLVYLDHGNHQIHVRDRAGKVSNLTACVHELDTLGLLHYLETSPHHILRKSIGDCIGFGYLPANLTVENMLLFSSSIEKLGHDLELPNKTIYGRHKARRVVQGYHRLLKTGAISSTYTHSHHSESAAARRSQSHSGHGDMLLHRVGNLEEMIGIVKSTSPQSGQQEQLQSVSAGHSLATDSLFLLLFGRPQQEEYSDYYVQPWFLRVYGFVRAAVSCY